MEWPTISFAACLLWLFVLTSAIQGQDTPAGARDSRDRVEPELQSRQGSERPYQPEMEARPAPVSGGPAELKWRLSPGERLYQELIVTQKSLCRVQGIAVSTGLKYVVLSSFFVEEVTDEGAVTVLQRIDGARLLEADALARSVFEGLLKKLSGETFRIKLSPEMKLLAFEADEDAFPVVAGGNPTAGEPLMMASLVDRDGWRELNQLTFFQPERSLRSGDRWQESLEHSWGQLGNWAGQAAYRYEGERDGLDRVAYEMRLRHRPGKARQGNLPFRMANASFQHEKAEGRIEFDRSRGRVERAEEAFHVRGSLTIELLGRKIPVEVIEQQDFQLRLYENRLGRRDRSASQTGRDRLLTDPESAL